MTLFGLGSKMCQAITYIPLSLYWITKIVLFQWLYGNWPRSACSGQVEPRESNLNTKSNSFALRNYCSPSLRFVSPFFLMTEKSGEKVLSFSLFFSVQIKRVTANIKVIAGFLQCTIKAHKALMALLSHTICCVSSLKSWYNKLLENNKSRPAGQFSLGRIRPRLMCSIHTQPW